MWLSVVSMILLAIFNYYNVLPWAEADEACLAISFILKAAPTLDIILNYIIEAEIIKRQPQQQ